MKDVDPDRDYAVASFQVGLGDGVVAVYLNLRTHGPAGAQPMMIRLTPAMAEMLGGHLREASAAAALGDVPTPLRQ